MLIKKFFHAESHLASPLHLGMYIGHIWIGARRNMKGDTRGTQEGKMWCITVRLPSLPRINIKDVLGCASPTYAPSLTISS